jgi:quercetin dioxygenase-like cupin family protein
MQSWDIRSLGVEPHHPQVLRSDDEVRAIAVTLAAGEELQEHQVHERTYMFVADGEIEIEQEGGSITGSSGFVAHFEPTERRRVSALSDALLVLVLAPWPGVGHPSARTSSGVASSSNDQRDDPRTVAARDPSRVRRDARAATAVA